MSERKKKRCVVEENVVEGMGARGRSGTPADQAGPRGLAEKVRAEEPFTWFHLWLELGKQVESKKKICVCAGYYSVPRGQKVRGLPVCQCTDRRKRALLAFAQVKKIIDRDWA